MIRSLIEAALFIVIVVLLAIVPVFWVPTLQLASSKALLEPKDYLTLENSFRATLAQIMGGVILLIGLYFTSKSLKATQDAAASNLKQAQETLRLSQEGQITERFTKAVEQLGSLKLEVRIGGIYALERIARDSERDYWVVMDVLSAFVRENARLNVTVQQEHRLRADFQAVLTVLGRSRTWTVESGLERVLDLVRVNLEGLHLSNSRLSGVFFFGASLKSAMLSGCSFVSCNFTGVNLDDAVVNTAELRSCGFNSASLKRAHFADSTFQLSSFGSADLEEASFFKANCEGCPFDNANLKNASFEGANLRGAKLFGANMEGTKFRGAHLEGADLSNAKGLTADQIGEAFFDANTKLPEPLSAR